MSKILVLIFTGAQAPINSGSRKPYGFLTSDAMRVRKPQTDSLISQVLIHNSLFMEKISINVGGTVFVTLKSTLLKSEYFKALLSGKYKESEELFVDENPRDFEVLLDYLRTGQWRIQDYVWNASMLDSNPEQIRLYQRAEFYGIQPPVTDHYIRYLAGTMSDIDSDIERTADKLVEIIKDYVMSSIQLLPQRNSLWIGTVSAQNSALPKENPSDVAFWDDDLTEILADYEQLIFHGLDGTLSHKYIEIDIEKCKSRRGKLWRIYHKYDCLESDKISKKYKGWGRKIR